MLSTLTKIDLIILSVDNHLNLMINFNVSLRATSKLRKDTL